MGNNGDGGDVLLACMGYREERTRVLGHGNPTPSHNDYGFLCNSFGREHKFRKVINQ